MRSGSAGKPVVQELLLFGTVDRSFWLPNDETRNIPDTVVKAFHAMRDQSMGSRQTFGNCGMKSAATRDNHLVLKSFKTTHGGIGGWPNGPSRVMPGFGAEDFAYVAEHGLVMGAIKAARDPRQTFIHESMEPYPTIISPQQERHGMRAAWSWMRKNVFSTLPDWQVT